MKLEQIDPLADSRWMDFVLRHPRASVFHSPNWLAALKKTYGYSPVVYTTSERGRPLQNGIVLCKVGSWATGTRLVSVPFSDHCEVLVDDADTLQYILGSLVKLRTECALKYIELRPLSWKTGQEAQPSFINGDEFRFHALDLRPSLDDIFHNFHKSCVQRKIHRADREKLEYESGRSENLLAKFYHLLLLTRRRHQ